MSFNCRSYGQNDGKIIVNKTLIYKNEWRILEWGVLVG